MEEIWKNVVGYENYMVSNMGNIKSLYNGKILKQRKNNKKYLQVNLHKQGIIKTYLVHRLVAEAFIENPNNLPQVNHIDEDKTNNAANNLEYCDAAYNNNYGTHNEKLSKQVLCVETGKIYSSTMEIQRQLGYKNSNISRCCNGIQKTAYGYTWKYV